MTPREIARAIVENHGLSANAQAEQILSMVVKVLTAAAAALIDEREACARVAEAHLSIVKGAGLARDHDYQIIAANIARDIRVRSL